MKVLVTGHDGYIGCVLVPLLRSKGHTVVGLDSYLFDACGFDYQVAEIPALRMDVRDVLLALPGTTEPLVDAFLQYRRGPDGIDGTDDDAKFKSLEDVRAALGFSPEQFKALGRLVGFRDPIFRIVSVGKSGETTRVVQMVIRKVGAAPQMITWKEL